MSKTVHKGRNKNIRQLFEVRGPAVSDARGDAVYSQIEGASSGTASWNDEKEPL